MSEETCEQVRPSPRHMRLCIGGPTAACRVQLCRYRDATQKSSPRLDRGGRRRRTEALRPRYSLAPGCSTAMYRRGTSSPTPLIKLRPRGPGISTKPWPGWDDGRSWRGRVAALGIQGSELRLPFEGSGHLSPFVCGLRLPWGWLWLGRESMDLGPICRVRTKMCEMMHVS